ncbi:MAG: SpoIIE family protein phosphatase [Marinifilaceae bacterium]|jgi:hypothetical protein|nr:SpoIIE family protein phosphatase [Marinifilaceae bacterium]
MEKYFVEIAYNQIKKDGKSVCGDVFLSRKIKAENRSIAILSDGLGSGIKANVLATMTASMAMNFTKINEPIERTAEIIMNTLPVDSERKISYASFSILDIENSGETKVVEYGNPQFILIRKGKDTKIDHNIVEIQNKNIRLYKLKAEKQDRIILFSDGVSQSGMGKEDMPFGWQNKEIKKYIENLINEDKYISAHKLSRAIVNKAKKNDSYVSKDDITCSVIYFRKPRKVLVCTGPPYRKESDKLLSSKINNFEGKKVVCGGTTALIVSRELKKEINVDLKSSANGLPPVSYMEGVDLITEGILTLGGVVKILEEYNKEDKLEDSPAGRLVDLFLLNDEINFLVGTKINDAHQDPNLPVELEIRRNVVKKIVCLLEEKYLKKVNVEYI